MYWKLKDLKIVKMPRRFRCSLSRGRTIADMAFARKNVNYGQWFYLNRKVLYTAIENADETIKEEILEILLKDKEVEVEVKIEEKEEEVNLDEVVDGETEVEVKIINTSVEEMGMEELFELASELGVATRKNNTKETLVNKIKEKLGEIND